MLQKAANFDYETFANAPGEQLTNQIIELAKIIGGEGCWSNSYQDAGFEGWSADFEEGDYVGIVLLAQVQ